MAGVDRRILDRMGDEVARATSVVRYAPGSHFSPHVHTGGEEFLVLEGVFQDEHGDFPAGSYIRNPPTSRHAPGSEPGCIILVKLWQFDLADRTHVHIDTHKMQPINVAERPDVRLIPLFHDDREDVRIELWAPGAAIEICNHKGLEIFVLEGAFAEGSEEFNVGSWLRLPARQAFMGTAGADGTKVWIKSDHLEFPPLAPLA